jgi:hypothetical protein
MNMAVRILGLMAVGVFVGALGNAVGVSPLLTLIGCIGIGIVGMEAAE